MSFLVLHWYWLLHCWVLSLHERHFTVLVHVTLTFETSVKMEQKCAPLQWLLMGWLLVLSGICRYPHVLLCLMGTDSFGMLWARYTLSIPIYIVSVITEGSYVTIILHKGHSVRFHCHSSVIISTIKIHLLVFELDSCRDVNMVTKKKISEWTCCFYTVGVWDRCFDSKH